MLFHLVVSGHDALDTYSREIRCAGRDGAEGIFGWDRNECIESNSNAAWVGPQSCRNESPFTHITSPPFSSLSMLSSDAYQDIQARRTAKNSQTTRSNPIQSSPGQGAPQGLPQYINNIRDGPQLVDPQEELQQEQDVLLANYPRQEGPAG